MGDVYNSYHGNVAAGALVDSRKSGGKLRIFPFKYTFAAGVGAAPVLRNMAKVPAGTIIYGLYLETDGLSISGGLALTIKIGDAANDSRYVAAFDADVAGNSSNITLAGHGYENTADTEIYGTVAAGKTPTTGKSLWGFFIGSAE